MRFLWNAVDQSENGISQVKADFIGYLPGPIKIGIEQVQYFYDVIELKTPSKRQTENAQNKLTNQSSEF